MLPVSGVGVLPPRARDVPEVSALFLHVCLGLIAPTTQEWAQIHWAGSPVQGSVSSGEELPRPAEKDHVSVSFQVHIVSQRTVRYQPDPKSFGSVDVPGLHVCHPRPGPSFVVVQPLEKCVECLDRPQIEIGAMVLQMRASQAICLSTPVARPRCLVPFLLHS